MQGNSVMAGSGASIKSVQRESSERMTVIILCILWYIVSSSNNVIGKMVFNQFPYPTTVTMVQLLSITVYSGPFFKFFKIRPYAELPRRYYLRIIVPLAIGKFLASVASHVSLWKVPVSYAHTVKGTMPLFTVILSQLILRERHTRLVYLSLLPIVVGVIIASLTEISFDLIGLISALISTMGFSLQNIYSKKVLKDTGIHHLRLLHMLGRLALFMFLPVWAYIDFALIRQPAILINSNYYVILLLLCDGILNWLQNIIAFSVMSMVTPLTYSVSSAFKRIFVIGVSLFILGNPVTALNIVGMLLTCLGVLAYNRAKMIARQQYQLLPTTIANSNGGVGGGANKPLMNGNGNVGGAGMMMSTVQMTHNGGDDENFFSSKQNLLLNNGYVLNGATNRLMFV